MSCWRGSGRLSAPDTSRVAFTVIDAARPAGSETSYYVRVTQTDGHQAWSSPIWVGRQLSPSAEPEEAPPDSG